MNKEDLYQDIEDISELFGTYNYEENNIYDFH